MKRRLLKKFAKRKAEIMEEAMGFVKEKALEHAVANARIHRQLELLQAIPVAVLPRWVAFRRKTDECRHYVAVAFEEEDIRGFVEGMEGMEGVEIAETNVGAAVDVLVQRCSGCTFDPVLVEGLAILRESHSAAPVVPSVRERAKA